VLSETFEFNVKKVSKDIGDVKHYIHNFISKVISFSFTLLASFNLLKKQKDEVLLEGKSLNNLDSKIHYVR